jgi:hypothetical protein
VFLSLAFASAHAITIEPPSSPAAINPNDNATGALPQPLLKMQEHDAIAPDIQISDPANHASGRSISLTSGQLPTDKDMGLSPPAPLVLEPLEQVATARALRSHAQRNFTVDGSTIFDAFVLPDPFTLLTGAATVVIAVTAVLFCRHFWRRNERRFRFGLLWDGNRQPLCTKCSRLLEVLNDYSFQCPACQVELGAREESGLTIAPHEALAKIRQKEYWL